MSDITFKVSLKEANLIFKSLGTLPFSEVYELIGKLNEQANDQLAGKEEAGKNLLNGKKSDKFLINPQENK